MFHLLVLGHPGLPEDRLHILAAVTLPEAPSLHCCSGQRDFELYHMDVVELLQHLHRDWYDRIEVGILVKWQPPVTDAKLHTLPQMANISDEGYVGTRESLNMLTPFLRTPQQNPHATILTLYLNAVMEVVKMGDEKEAAPDVRLLTQYLPNFRLFPPPLVNGAEMCRLWDARALTLDVEKFFKKD